MARHRITRTDADVAAIRRKGNHKDSRSAAWFAVGCGSNVILDIQTAGTHRHEWEQLKDALPIVDEQARTILKMRQEAIAMLKRAPHHRRGFRLSAHTGAAEPRPVNALCLVSGHKGQEIPGLVAYDRVVVDAEHMEQALGPATLTEIFEIRRKIGENVYISTNVSETPQIVRDLRTGAVDVRATSALTASKVIAAIEAGVDVVKVGFANLDPYKRDLPQKTVLAQMKLTRELVDEAVAQRLLVIPLNLTGRYPLISVFFPEIGIDNHGQRPREIAELGIELTAKAGWQGMLIDTFEKFTQKRYGDFYSLQDTAELARLAHKRGIEFWIAGSIKQAEVADLLRCKVDLICFGGAARHSTGKRTTGGAAGGGDRIRRDLVEQLVAVFERVDRRRRSRQGGKP